MLNKVQIQNSIIMRISLLVMGISLLAVLMVNKCEARSLLNNDTGSFDSVRAFCNNCKSFDIDPRSFVKVKELSGADSYYSIMKSQDEILYIHAEYLPPEKTVKLGYQFHDSICNVKKISWDWRIIDPPSGANENVKGKNDSGASVYLVFNDKMRTFTIKYVFSSELPPGTVIRKDPVYPLKRMYMVVANSLKVNQRGEWQHVEIDVESDFKRLYENMKYIPVRGIGLMTDGDGTNSHVVADYRSFRISYMEK